MPVPLRVADIYRASTTFKARLKTLKRQLKGPALEWYPYDSLRAFEVLNTLLSGAHDELLSRISADPILDLGCGDGEVSFFLESLGCTVDAVDYIATNFNQMRGIATLRAALSSQVSVCSIDLDRQFELPRQHYGLVLLFGVLYHIKNPMFLMETLAERSSYCILSTRVAALTTSRRLIIRDEPLAYLVDAVETNHDSTNYWILSETCLKRLFHRTGWNVKAWFTFGDVEGSDPACDMHDQRVFCLLESTAAKYGTAIQLGSGWHHVEKGNWRWTEWTFSVVLSSLMRSGTEQQLRFHFILAPVLHEYLQGTVHLRVTAGDQILATFVLQTVGEQYIDVPLSSLSVLAGSRAEVTFQLNDGIPPNEVDTRHLGLIASFYRFPFQIT